MLNKPLKFINVLFWLLIVSFELFCKILDIYDKYRLNLIGLSMSCPFQILNTRIRSGPNIDPKNYRYFNCRLELTWTREKPTRTRTEKFLSTYWVQMFWTWKTRTQKKPTRTDPKTRTPRTCLVDTNQECKPHFILILIKKIK